MTVPQSQSHILIVDDIADNRDLLSRRLVRQRHKVTAAENGQSALNLIAQTPFDLVLLDIMIPVMDGFEVLVSIERPSKLMLFSDGVYENLKPDGSLMNLDEFLKCVEKLPWDATSASLLDLIRETCSFPFEDNFSLVQVTFQF
jgi:two-component SAPR family response regulator